MTSLNLHAGAAATIAALALAASAAAPTPASAGAPAPSRPAFALTPVGTSGALLMRGRPGRVLHGAVLVRNLSGHRITIKLQRADIRGASNGNADYGTTGLSRTGRWLKLAATTVRLNPHASRKVAYTVRVPVTARGASHYAGIVGVDAAELAVKTRKRKSFSFNRVTRQALPLTVRLPGPLTRSLALRSLEIKVEPAGAGLVLGLLPGGTELIARAGVKLRVLRGSRAVVTHDSTLGQLFPGAGLNFRIPLVSQPTKGSYRVVGVIRPERAAPIYIDQTIGFSPAKAAELEREATPGAPLPGLPLWVWLVLGGAGCLLVMLLLLVWKLRRRPVEQVT
jgi:hypothetical protein